MRKSMFFAIAAMAALLTVSAYSQNKTPRVDTREARQQKRIEQGAKSGALTTGEVKTLERQESKIKSDEIMAKSDGKVTPAERKQLNKELNHESNRIYRKKHNAKVQG